MPSTRVTPVKWHLRWPAWLAALLGLLVSPAWMLISKYL